MRLSAALFVTAHVAVYSGPSYAECGDVLDCNLEDATRTQEPSDTKPPATSSEPSRVLLGGELVGARGNSDANQVTSSEYSFDVQFEAEDQDWFFDRDL